MSIFITSTLCLKVITLHMQWRGLLHETVEFGSTRVVHLADQLALH